MAIEMAAELRYCLRVMKTLPIEICDGVLRLPGEIRLPPNSHLAVIVIGDDESGLDVAKMAEAGGGVDFLSDEPDLYSDADILPERRNPRFKGRRGCSALVR
ncbi:MAG TPA: hypothetical protein VFC44_19410 [Candidatus Saccharimonadales bacterium]|nr:hypothetical protein [Candidatus Saccharimonadales bacterium]